MANSTNNHSIVEEDENEIRDEFISTTPGLANNPRSTTTSSNSHGNDSPQYPGGIASSFLSNSNSNPSSPTLGGATANKSPPPTYNPAFVLSSPTGITAAPKPRKSNRISVLAYPTMGGESGTENGGVGSPQLGIGRFPGSTGPPPLPKSPGFPPNMSTMPPMLNVMTGQDATGLRPSTENSASTTPIPVSGDFRTAEIKHHWNDPPKQIFHKESGKDDGAAFDFGPMKGKLETILQKCTASVPVAQKRMLEDTTKRIQSLIEQMDKGTVKERVVAPLGEMIEALSERSFATCQAIHAKLMQTDFDSEGRWLLGFRRLIDMYSATSA